MSQGGAHGSGSGGITDPGHPGQRLSAEFLSTDGVRKMLELLQRLNVEKGWGSSLLGVFPTQVPASLREQRAPLPDRQQSLGDRLLAPIHRATVLSECAGLCKTIFEHAPSTRAAEEYEALVSVVLRVS